MENFFSRFREILIKPFPAALFATSLAMVIYLSVPFFSRIDVAGRDLIFQMRHLFRKPPEDVNKLLLISIDDISIQKIKVKWPWPRKIYGEAISKIAPFQPKVIGFDFVFQGEDQMPGSDEILINALQEAGNVVLASYLSPVGQLISAHPPVREASYRTAIVNKIVDRDGIVRRAPVFFKNTASKTVQWSWESEIFFKAIDYENPSLIQGKTGTLIRSKTGREFKFPNNQGVLDIDYIAKFEDFPILPFWKLMEGKVNPALFKDRIVLVGLTALPAHDFHLTPLRSVAGLAINANTILTLLRQNFLIRVPLPFTWLLLFLSLWLILQSVERYSILTSFLVVISVSALYIGMSFAMLWWNVIWDLSYTATICILVFFFAVLYKQFQIAVENIRLREESVRDPLTGFYTRRFLEVHLKMDVKKVLSSTRSGFGTIEEVSIVMIDLDNFKLVNDSFGHPEGDRVLKRLGESIRASVRRDELVCRFGGDEFCVILPGTSLENAIQFAEKLRLVISNDPELNYTTQAGVKTFRVTGSFGVASVKGTKAMNPENLLKAADRALYRAKKGGRNQVCVFDPERDVIDGD